MKALIENEINEKEKILIIEDEKELLELTVDNLNAFGYHVIGVPTSQLALEKWRTKNFHASLLILT